MSKSVIFIDFSERVGLMSICREIMNPIEANTSVYNAQIGYVSGITTTAAESLLPLYGGSVIPESIPPQKQVIKSDNNSTLTYNKRSNLPLPARKRSRYSFSNQILSYPLIQTHKTGSPFPFLGQDLSLQIQEQQFDVDHLISQHVIFLFFFFFYIVKLDE